MRLLLIEDDDAFGAAMAAALVQGGHSVDWLHEGRLMDGRLAAYRFDAVLLDLSLPDVDGRALLRALRARRDGTPVIVISARGQRSDRIELLDDGADDYLVKPVDIGELEARLRAVVRRGRPHGAAGASLDHGALRVDTRHGTVALRKRRLALRERERLLLELFMRDPERTFTRAQIESEMFGDGAPVDVNTVAVYIHYLRRQIAADIIVTVRGQGYRLGPPLAET